MPHYRIMKKLPAGNFGPVGPSFSRNDPLYAPFYPGMVTQAITLGTITEPGTYLIACSDNSGPREVCAPIEVESGGLRVA